MVTNAVLKNHRAGTLNDFFLQIDDNQVRNIPFKVESMVMELSREQKKVFIMDLLQHPEKYLSDRNVLIKFVLDYI